MLKHTKLSAVAIAVSAACGLAMPAHADTSIEIYGKLYPEYNKVWLSDATAKGTQVSTLTTAPAGAPDFNALSMDSPNSRLGFRGVEKLGGNLKAFFQLEMAFGVDTGELNTAGQIFGRDTFVGLGGDFGTVRLGNMDTVYKTLGDTLSFLGISSGNFMSTSNILSKPGIGTSSAASFHLRRTNSLIYETPSFNGFGALFDYSLGEVAGGSSKKGSVFSTGVKYKAGPIYAALAYERHYDLFGGSKNVASALRNDSNALAHSTDNAVRLTGQYRFTKSTRVEVNIAQLKYTETGGAVGKFSEYKHKAWSIGIDQKFGAVTVDASYGRGDAGTCSLVGGAACSTDGLDGQMFNLGAGYSLSKRTMLFAVGSVMRNGKSATYSNYLNGKPAAGQDIKIASVGISHSF